MEFAHRTNTFQSFFEAYYIHGCRHFEIDVQPTKEFQVVVYHDDISDKSYHDVKFAPTLEEFLKFTPDSITLNVEIKKYENSKYITDIVQEVCNRYPNKSYIYSSFDVSSVKRLRENEANPMLLIDKIEKYDSISPIICVHKDLLDKVENTSHQSIFVYDVKAEELQPFKDHYPYVKGWIVDY